MLSDILEHSFQSSILKRIPLTGLVARIFLQNKDKKKVEERIPLESPMNICENFFNCHISNASQ